MLITDIPRGWRAECNDGDGALLRMVGPYELSIAVPNADAPDLWEWWVTHKDRVVADGLGGAPTMMTAMLDAVDAVCGLLGGAE